MNQNQNTPQALNDQLLDLKQAAEKLKARLTPDIKRYVDEHMAAAQEKLARGEHLTKGDFDFIGKLQRWISMPESYRHLFTSFESMEKEEPDENNPYVSKQQWKDLLHLAEASHKVDKVEWIAKTFSFPGNGEIVAESSLSFYLGTNLKKLPDGLKPKRSLNLSGCHNLTSLPEGLEVGETLVMDHCEKITSLQNLPPNLVHLDLAHCTGIHYLPEDLRVKGNLTLDYCLNLKELPKNLWVGRSLHIAGCNSLTRFPDSVHVGKDIFVSDYLNQQVQADLQKRVNGRKLNGVVEYV